jgi:two-component system response regulator HydG
LDQIERATILAALQRAGGNKTKAAGELGISRRTLHRKLRDYARAGAPADGPEAAAKER